MALIQKDTVFRLHPSEISPGMEIFGERVRAVTWSPEAKLYEVHTTECTFCAGSKASLYAALPCPSPRDPASGLCRCPRRPEAVASHGSFAVYMDPWWTRLSQHDTGCPVRRFSYRVIPLPVGGVEWTWDGSTNGWELPGLYVAMADLLDPDSLEGVRESFCDGPLEATLYAARHHWDHDAGR